MNKNRKFPDRNLPGSQWWKMDFHTHTPASDAYGRGDKSVPLGTTAEVWLQKTMEAKLDCVVVTDHNSGDWIDILNDQYQELLNREDRPRWFRELTLFPGIEVTVLDGQNRIPLLAVFDVSSGREAVVSFLGKCEIFSRHGDGGHLVDALRFEDVVDTVTKMGGIAVPARLDEDQDLLEKLNRDPAGLSKKFEGLYVTKVSNPRALDKAEGPLKKIINRLTKIMGSDSYKPEETGRLFTWIKMSRPSIEQLELALKNQSLCVKNQAESPNREPDIYLNKLIITSMSHCGRIKEKPFELRFHPHFNAIIGGRGSGKSTALESVRIAARRGDELDETSLRKEFNRFTNFVKDKGVMLPETRIQLEICRREKQYRLSWQKDETGTVLEEWDESGSPDSGWNVSDAGNLQERFPLSIYSQKQINELASNPRGLLGIIDRTSDVGYGEWQGRWEKAKSQFLQLRERLREIKLELDSEPELRIQLQDVENDLKLYEDKGYKGTLKLYQTRAKQKDHFEVPSAWDDLIVDIFTMEERIVIPEFPSALFEDGDSDSEKTLPELKTLHDETSKELRGIRASLKALAESLDKLRERYPVKLKESAWYSSYEEARAQYDALVADYAGNPKALSLSAYGQWVEQRSHLQQQLQRMDALHKDALDVVRQIRNTRKTLRALRKELHTERARFIRKVIGDSPYVRMELVPFGDVSVLEEEYRTILNLTDGSFESSILDGGKNNEEGLLAALFNWEKERLAAGQNPGERLRILVAAVKSETLHLRRDRDGGGAFNKRVRKLLSEQPEIADRLLCWWPEDLLKIKYSKDPQSGKFYDLEKGSAGQKAAAILAFLLSYGEEPLVIDQPEDDLDNTLISDLIVRQIHENKPHRQLLIVSHNPNIVVNGDAELVHVMRYANGQVMLERQGGLEEKEIRHSICSIIEGGREAFEKRYRRLANMK